MHYLNTNVILKLLLTTVLLSIFKLSIAQIPTSCFEIESILVDACGFPEGQNEMVRFQVGGTALNTANLTVNWPNNPWLSICQNSATASAVAALNATIVSCGKLLEPTAGVLPAGADVLLITSTAVDVTANSFTNLSDTMYVIFQCAGNTAGHFVNYSSIPGLRTLEMSFSSPTNCGDTVTYDKSLLVNQNGNPGGSTAVKNGAIVNFDWAGTATYDNQGCQAPFNPTSVQLNTSSSFTICPGDSIKLTTNTQGNVLSYFWVGNYGSFNNPNADSATYYSSLNDTLPFYIKVGGITVCNDTIYDSVQVNLLPHIVVTITGADTLNLCQGQSLALTGNGAINYLWNTGDTSNQISVTSGGLYTVNGNNACYTDSDAVYVNLIPQIAVLIAGLDTVTICQGDSVTLVASGAPNYLWNTSSTLDSITVSTQGLYYVNSSNSCFNVADSVLINVMPQLNVTITEPDTVSICVGDSIQIHANGGVGYVWSTGQTNLDSLMFYTAGNYYVTANNICFSDTAFFAIDTMQNITVNIIESNPISICQGNSVTLHAFGASSYTWSTMATTDSITVSNAGTYFVSGTGNCPSTTDTVTINVISPLSINITANNPTILCVGDTITLHVTGGVNYIWNNVIASDSIVVNTVGQYFVTATNNVCPSVSDTINIINDVVPSATITGDSIVCTGSSIVLNASGNGTFSWSNGSTGNSTIISVAQQLILSATNSCNNIVTDTLMITEQDCNIKTAIFIPNVITPNNDNQNDIFKISGINLTAVEGSIYNRWGQLLFTWNEMNDGWDGTYQGEIVAEGTYFYVVKATFIANITKTYNGAVLLLQ